MAAAAGLSDTLFDSRLVKSSLLILFAAKQRCILENGCTYIMLYFIINRHFSKILWSNGIDDCNSFCIFSPVAASLASLIDLWPWPISLNLRRGK